MRDAASTSWLAIAYAGCQPPCHPPHGTKEHPPCAQTPHGVPWLVFLSSKKTGAPSSLHTQASARSYRINTLYRAQIKARRSITRTDLVLEGPSPPYFLGL